MLPEETYDQPVRVEWKIVASIRAEAPTTTNTDLAKRVGVNVNTMTRWLNDPHYQRYENWVLKRNFEDLPLGVKVTVMDVAERFAEEAPAMQERLMRIIEQVQDPKLEAELVHDWLDRAGFAAQRKVGNGNMTTFIMTKEAAEVFMRRAEEANLIVEAEVVSKAG